MQDELFRMLEEIEVAPLGNRPTVHDLINKGTADQNIVVERRRWLNVAFYGGFIEITNNYTINDDSATFSLIIAGREYLNRIRIEKATELIAKSSKRLEGLTKGLIFLTVILAIMTGITIFR